MYQLAKLVLKSYMPRSLEKGMLFYTNVGQQLKVIMLEDVPRDHHEYMRTHGAPVELYIISHTNPNTPEYYIIAQPHQIGWIDEGDHTDELRDITITDVNTIMENYDGFIKVDVDERYIDDDEVQYDDMYKLVANIYMEKAIIAPYYEYYDQQEYILEGDEEWTVDDDNDSEQNQIS